MPLRVSRDLVKECRGSRVRMVKELCRHANIFFPSGPFDIPNFAKLSGLVNPSPQVIIKKFYLHSPLLLSSFNKISGI
jgi:hypothetical protein